MDQLDQGVSPPRANFHLHHQINERETERRGAFILFDYHWSLHILFLPTAYVSSSDPLCKFWIFFLQYAKEVQTRNLLCDLCTPCLMKIRCMYRCYCRRICRSLCHICIILFMLMYSIVSARMYDSACYVLSCFYVIICKKYLLQLIPVQFGIGACQVVATITCHLGLLWSE